MEHFRLPDAGVSCSAHISDSMSVMSCPSPMPGPRMAARLKVGPPHKSILRPLWAPPIAVVGGRVHQAQAEVPGVDRFAGQARDHADRAACRRTAQTVCGSPAAAQRLNTAKKPTSTSKIRILAELTKLRQICCDPRSGCTPDAKDQLAKLAAITELVETCVNEGKGAQFLEFTSFLLFIAERFDAQCLASSTPSPAPRPRRSVSNSSTSSMRTIRLPS